MISSCLIFTRLDIPMKNYDENTVMMKIPVTPSAVLWNPKWVFKPRSICIMILLNLKATKYRHVKGNNHFCTLTMQILAFTGYIHGLDFFTPLFILMLTPFFENNRFSVNDRS